MQQLLSLLAATLILLAFSCNSTKTTTVDNNESVKETMDADWNKRLHDIWVLNSMNGKEVKSMKNRPRLELFPADHKMLGHGGCNSLFGNVKAGARNIHFSDIGSTKMYCADSMPTEMEFVKTLASVQAYEIKSLQLHLFDENGLVMSFQKVD